MKRLLFTIFLLITISLFNAQPPIIKETLNNPLKPTYQNFNNRKQTLLEKEIIILGEFKGLTIEKITLKDTSNQSSLSVLGLMTFSETFDQISKKTTILEKEDLSKFIDALEKLEKNTSTKPANETKFKYLTSTNIEVGSVYNQTLKNWEHYLKIPQSTYNRTAMGFNTNELRDLVKLLKKAEQHLQKQ